MVRAKKVVPEAIITKATFMQMLNNADSHEKRKKIVGRALVALYHRQTSTEQARNETREHNTVGFNATDASDGSRSAKYFIAHGTLEAWQYQLWVQIRRGYPRICKYTRQLNEIAEAKADRLRTHLVSEREALQAAFDATNDLDEQESLAQRIQEIEGRLGI